MFEVQGTQIKRVEGKMSSELALDTLIGPEDERKAGPSVEETVDGAQVLDGDSISALRASGASGQEIIAALVENSATFKDKTEFAKQKYLKKKAIKWAAILMLQLVDMICHVVPVQCQIRAATAVVEGLRPLPHRGFFPSKSAEDLVSSLPWCA